MATQHMRTSIDVPRTDSTSGSRSSTATPRGWFGRNWKWFLPAMFAAVVALAGLAVFGYVQVRAYHYRANPAYQAALAEVQASDEIQQRLGEPIVDSDWNPQGAIDLRNNGAMGEARFNFTVSGPEGHGDVTADGRMVDGDWALARLEVLFGDGERVRLTEQVRAKQKVDTPQFDPNQAKRQKSQQPPEKEDGNEAGPSLDVEVPDLPPGLK
jgi:hypothetical protein